MIKKNIFWLASLVVLVGWPVSLMVNPPTLKTEFIWQMNDAGEEKRILLQKLGLDASPLKRIFYNTKTTILSDRYTKNVLTLADPDNYFFGSRLKFVYSAVIGFLVGIYVSVKKKKYTGLWKYGFWAVVFTAFFKNPEGWNIFLLPVPAFISFIGLKEINKYKFGWAILLLIAVMGITELGRPAL